MAIFSSKSNNDKALAQIEDAEVIETSTDSNSFKPSKGSSLVISPRLSEKAGNAGKLNKYIFTVAGSGNKISVKQAVEKLFGVKIADINMISVKGKSRRSGRGRIGRTSNFKKAIVTLTKDSKRIDIVEPS